MAFSPSPGCPVLLRLAYRLMATLDVEVMEDRGQVAGFLLKTYPAD